MCERVFFENLVKTNCGSLSDLKMLAIPCMVNICVWFHLICGTPAGFVTAWFPAVTYLGLHMRGGGLFEQWPWGHRVKTSVMSRFHMFFRSVLVQTVRVFPEFWRCNIVASLWVVLMAFHGLNVEFKVDLYKVCYRLQLQDWYFHELQEAIYRRGMSVC